MVIIKVDIRDCFSLDGEKNNGKNACRNGFRLEEIISSCLTGELPAGVSPENANIIRKKLCKEMHISKNSITFASSKGQELTKTARFDKRTKTDILVKTKNGKRYSISAKFSGTSYVGVLETPVENLISCNNLPEKVNKALVNYKNNGYALKNMSQTSKITLKDFFEADDNKRSFIEYVVKGASKNEIQKPTHILFYNYKKKLIYFSTVKEYISLVMKKNKKGTFGSCLTFTRSSGAIHELKIKTVNPLKYFD